MSMKGYATPDETRLVVAGCRHSLALKAVNMFAGEKYCYYFFLHKAVSERTNVKFVWQDITCKYWPWPNKK